ncbi:MAG TPA: hypothetical protein VJQ85_07005 [Gaiellaceae bacterium]|nr:hypothetical protein [Gaiellaceae bacterium]
MFEFEVGRFYRRLDRKLHCVDVRQDLGSFSADRLAEIGPRFCSRQ